MITPQTHTHPSGIRIVLVPQPTAQVSYLGIGILTGSQDEPRLYHGLAHSIEHMLFKGTSTRSASEIIQQVEAVGGELNAFTTKEDTTLYAITPSAYAPDALELLLDLVSESIFPENEWLKEQEVIIEEIYSYEDSPAELIFDEFEDQVFRGSPLGHAILGTEGSVRRIKARHQQEFFRRQYKPERMVLFVQGSLTMEELISSVEQVFPSPQDPRAPELPLSLAQPLALAGKRQVRRQENAQSHVLIGCEAFHRDAPERFALSLLTNILGGIAMNSLLNLRLREEAGLVYQVEANYTPYTRTGIFSIYFGSSAEKEKQALDLVLDILKEVANQPMDQQAFDKAIHQLRGQLLVASENKEQQFLSLGKSFLHRNTYETNESLLECLTKLTPQDLQQVAKALFRPERLHTLIYR